MLEYEYEYRFAEYEYELPKSELTNTHLPSVAFRVLPWPTCSRFPAPGYRFPAPGYRPPVSGFRLPATGYRPPATGYRLPVSSGGGWSFFSRSKKSLSVVRIIRLSLLIAFSYASSVREKV